MNIVHEWEREAPVHAWDGGSDSGNDRWSDDEAVDADSPEAAAEEWMSVMLDLYWSRSITAGAFCQLCYWASKAGIEGLAGSCGQRPGLPSGHYQRHLDKTLGFRRERANLYKLEAPSLRRHDRGRSTQELLVVNPLTRPWASMLAATRRSLCDCTIELPSGCHLHGPRTPRGWSPQERRCHCHSSLTACHTTTPTR